MIEAKCHCRPVRAAEASTSGRQRTLTATVQATYQRNNRDALARVFSFGNVPLARNGTRIFKGCELARDTRLCLPNEAKLQCRRLLPRSLGWVGLAGRRRVSAGDMNEEPLGWRGDSPDWRAGRRVDSGIFSGSKYGPSVCKCISSVKLMPRELPHTSRTRHPSSSLLRIPRLHGSKRGDCHHRRAFNDIGQESKRPLGAGVCSNTSHSQFT